MAGKSTLTRLEHAPTDGNRDRRIAHDAHAIEHLFGDLFLDAHAKAPVRITLDLDASDDPIHGHQEGRFIHGYEDCHCDLSVCVCCGEHLLAAELRRSNVHTGLGAVEEIARIVAKSEWMPGRGGSSRKTAFALRHVIGRVATRSWGESGW